MELEECKRKAVAMLRGYRDNEICIRMLETQLQELEQQSNYISNMAVSYDQPGGGRTNKVTSPVENELIQLEQKREQLKMALTARRLRLQQTQPTVVSLSRLALLMLLT